MGVTHKGKRRFQSVEIKFDPIQISQKIMAFAKRKFSFFVWF